jgi:hypothetical protein
MVRVSNVEKLVAHILVLSTRMQTKRQMVHRGQRIKNRSRRFGDNGSNNAVEARQSRIGFGENALKHAEAELMPHIGGQEFDGARAQVLG